LDRRTFNESVAGFHRRNVPAFKIRRAEPRLFSGANTFDGRSNGFQPGVLILGRYAEFSTFLLQGHRLRIFINNTAKTRPAMTLGGGTLSIKWWLDRPLNSQRFSSTSFVAGTGVLHPRGARQ